VLSNFSPEAVLRPLNLAPYQEIFPLNVLPSSAKEGVAASIFAVAARHAANAIVIRVDKAERILFLSVIFQLFLGLCYDFIDIGFPNIHNHSRFRTLHLEHANEDGNSDKTSHELQVPRYFYLESTFASAAPELL
jgi:hypothetical protein